MSMPRHTIDDTASIDWTNLRQVIEYAESLGPDLTVFRYSHEGARYGITASENIPTNCMFTGEFTHAVGIGIFVEPIKVIVMFRTKRRVIRFR